MKEELCRIIIRKAKHLTTPHELLEFAEEWFAQGRAYKTVSAYYDNETDVYICDLDGRDRQKRFQVVFQNMEGSFPQKYEMFDTYEEAQLLVDRLNEQLDTPYANYYVREI